MPSLNASVGILDSRQAFPHDVAALASQLVAVGATPIISSCESVYDDVLYVVLLPHNCSVLPTNFIGWDIGGGGDSSPAQARWSSSTLSSIFPRFIDINMAQLHCSTHSLGTLVLVYFFNEPLGLPSSVLNFYHVFSPAAELYTDYATRRLNDLFRRFSRLNDLFRSFRSTDS